MLHYLLNFLYPPRCAACDTDLPIDTTRRVCASCLAAVEPPRPPLCLVCGAPLYAGDEEERCGHCRAAPPAFDSARAITRYRAGAADSGTDGSSAVAACCAGTSTGLTSRWGARWRSISTRHRRWRPAPTTSSSPCRSIARAFDGAASIRLRYWAPRSRGGSIARSTSPRLTAFALPRRRPRATAPSARATSATPSRCAAPRASPANGVAGRRRDDYGSDR